MDSHLSANKSTNGRSDNELVEVASLVSRRAPSARAVEAGVSAREQNHESLQRARAVLRVLDAVSSSLAARAAEPLFMTPRRHRRPLEEARAMAQARHETWRLAGHLVPVYSWGAGPVVLFAHGWEGRGSQAAPFVAPLVARGFRVVAWDQPGHGEASAARVTLIDFAQVLEAVVARLGEVHAVIGHSLGGTATIYARSRRQFGKRLVTISSPLHPREVLAEFGRILGLSAAALEGVKARLGAHYGVNFADFDLRQAVRTAEVDALVVHDRSDREVPYEHGLELFRHWPSAELFTTEGLGHRRILRDGQVVAKIVEVVAQTPRDQSWEQLISAELYEPQLRAG